MDTRRSFLRKTSILSGAAGLLSSMPSSLVKALAIDPAPGSTYLDAEHIVFLMQENRSFDHTYGMLQGVRGFNDPRAIRLPNENKVWLQSNKNGETYAPFRFNMKETKSTWMSSLPHSWSNQVDARNNGHYDKWLDIKPSGNEEYASMPLTMGAYSREDIPFYYSLADAFTVCDQNFCSSLTGTTPNRLYFWTGTVREKEDADALARVWNEDADYNTMVDWKTFPERLEEWGVSWKIYQNEISVGVGFEGEEEGWLANYGDNPLEYFKQYHVKFSPEFIANLPAAATKLSAEIVEKEKEISLIPAGSKQAKDAQQHLDWLKKQLAINKNDQKVYTRENYEKLAQHQKDIHQKAFSTNRNDPDYHELTNFTYHDGQADRTMKIPKGDILHQFREDVKNGTLPTVSWMVAPENFSDHPSAAWYGALYISEIVDILTQNPEVWKKTIFILTYDENDGYFDHVPPFVAPHPADKNTGKCSAGIDTSLEYVANEAQQSIASHARVSPIGLGYRVPMIIASPWSRGGWVNSEVFDHTSSLRFLEKFLSAKTGKKITEPNISAWRRAVCGDLTSAFRTYNNEKLHKPTFIEKKEFLEAIHKAKFKNDPANFKKLMPADIESVNNNAAAGLMASQEKGIRSACALPYELYVDGGLSANRKSFEIKFSVGNKLFGDRSAGSPFLVYIPSLFKGQRMQNRSYAVAAGSSLSDDWTLADFDGQRYDAEVYGPNGFYRRFKGHSSDPHIDIQCTYDHSGSGQVVIQIKNNTEQSQSISITPRAYHNKIKLVSIDKNASTTVSIPVSKSHGWYDVSITIKGDEFFERRFAGRVENGLPRKTDPLMGGIA